MYAKYGKRVLDVVVATHLLVILSPVLAFVAILVRVTLGSPVFFRQQRPGLNGTPFYMWKFRSMADWRDERGDLLPDRERMTRVGSFLRASSLDELPELFNVVRGEMSLVGPRPLLTRYLSRYSEEQRRRHEVKPGITGWAQVNGRNAISWEEKFALDVWYVDHVGFRRDLQILWRTVCTVLSRTGISAENHVSAPEFRGTQSHVVTETSSSDAIVLGASGHARVVIGALKAAGQNVVAVFDDNSSLWGSELDGVPIVGGIQQAVDLKKCGAIIAIGDNGVRRRLAQSLPLRWLTVRHPHSWVDPSVQLGPGTIVMAGSVIQPHVVVGAHVIINSASSVDHESQICDFCHVAPGCHLAGNVKVGEGAFLGIGSSVIQGQVIGAWSTIGAGAVVVQDLPADVVAMGCPARIARSTRGFRLSA